MPSRGNSADTGITSDLTNHAAGTGYSTVPVWPQKYLPRASPDNLALKGSEKVLWVTARQQELLEQRVQLPGTSKLCVCT